MAHPLPAAYWCVRQCVSKVSLMGNFVKARETDLDRREIVRSLAADRAGTSSPASAQRELLDGLGPADGMKRRLAGREHRENHHESQLGDQQRERGAVHYGLFFAASTFLIVRAGTPTATMPLAPAMVPPVSNTRGA